SLDAPIERTAAQPQRLRRPADVSVEPHERLADQQRLDLFQAHVVHFLLGWRLGSKVAAGDRCAGSHEHGPLPYMLVLTHLARPAVLEQRFHRRGVESLDALAIARRVLAEEA